MPLATHEPFADASKILPEPAKGNPLRGWSRIFHGCTGCAVGPVALEEGQDVGATLRHRLLIKTLLTTVIVSVAFTYPNWIVTTHPFSLDNISVLPEFAHY